MLRRTFTQALAGTATGTKVMTPDTFTSDLQCRNTLWQIDGRTLVATADIPDKAEYVEFQLVKGTVRITRPDGTHTLTDVTLTIRDSKVFCQVPVGKATQDHTINVTIHIN